MVLFYYIVISKLSISGSWGCLSPKWYFFITLLLANSAFPSPGAPWSFLGLQIASKSYFERLSPKCYFFITISLASWAFRAPGAHWSFLGFQIASKSNFGRLSPKWYFFITSLLANWAFRAPGAPWGFLDFQMPPNLILGACRQSDTFLLHCY